MSNDSPAPPEQASKGSVNSAFALLHPGVQRQLWKMGWTQLRQLQVDAIRLVMTTEQPLILSAATASGKTEAAFLPILSCIADEPTGSIRALYVGPLKALINDQFSRIEQLCEHLEVPVYRWHGDVSAAHKTKLVEQPGGVLLITPESLESLFVNRSQHLGRLFDRLQYVVIDELHSFLSDERGLHLRSLLGRLRGVSAGASAFRCIGLSATIGDYSIAQAYLDAHHPDSVQVVLDKSAGKELKLRIHAYIEEPPPEEDQEDDDRPSDAVMRMAEDIVTHCGGHANLVFTNAKGDVEEYADLCGRIAASQGLRDQFLVHHGSLSAEIRQDTEQTMKSGAVATTFCSSTLEMGVDIGGVRAIGQVGAPWSVASLKQRLGRSGRRSGEPQIVRMYIRCRRPKPDADLFDRFHLDLVQAIAVTQLMLEHWVEPATPPQWDLSTLTQQVISVVAQTGGIAAAVLYERLCSRGAFSEVDPSSFATLLRQLASKDLIEQMQGGDLILGLAGEHIRRDRGFYAVFPTPREYTILHDGRSLGTMQAIYEAGDHLLFAGRRWRVKEADHERLELHVVPARGWKRPKFGGGTGEIHPRIREKMRDVLLSTAHYAYLDQSGQQVLDQARRTASDAGIGRSRFLPLGQHKCAIFTWTGSRLQQTLALCLQDKGLDVVDEGIGFSCDASEAAARTAWDAAAAAGPSHFPPLDEESLRFLPRRKYDEFLGLPLVEKAYVKGWLDFAGARALLTAKA